MAKYMMIDLLITHIRVCPKTVVYHHSPDVIPLVFHQITILVSQFPEFQVPNVPYFLQLPAEVPQSQVAQLHAAVWGAQRTKKMGRKALGTHTVWVKCRVSPKSEVGWSF